KEMLRQIIIDEKHIFSLIHKVLCKSSTCIGGNVLKRRTVTGCSGKYRSIFHSAVFFQSSNQFCNCGRLLSDSYINTDHTFALLIQNSICSNGSLSCLTVPDDQLTLSPSDRKHGVNSQNTCFQWYGYRLTVDDAWCFIFHRAVILCLDLPFSVNG